MAKNAESFLGWRLILLYIGIGFGTFIQILDTSIANVAIPYIAGNLSVSADEGTWVITSFAASNSLVLPLTGWISTYFGRVRLFVISLVLFSFASFLCGFSTSLLMLVIFRALQGAVAGCLIPLSQTLLVSSVPKEKVGGALGIWGMIVVVAPVLGPIIGGYITEVYSWPWIFYINVPLGLFSAGTTWFLLHDRESEIKKSPIDWVGLFLLIVAVFSIQILLDKGKDLDWFSSEIIITLGVVSLISFSYFLLWSRTSSFPVVDLSFFADRNFALSTLMITLGFLLYFGGTVILPLWLQTVQGYTPFSAGLTIAPVGIIPVLLSPLVGKNLYRFDIRKVASLSFLAFAISFFYQAHFTSNLDIRTIMWARLLQGIGITIFFIPILQLSLTNIPEEKYASASGLFHFIRILVGSGFGTSLSIELSSRREILHHNQIADTLTQAAPEIHLFQTGIPHFPGFLPEESPTIILDALATKESFMLATNDLSYLAGALFLLMIPIPFLCKSPKKISAILATGD